MHCIAWVRIVPPNPRGDGNTEKYCPRPEYIHCKIANFGARQATLSDIARQAFVAETKLLVYNECYDKIANLKKAESGLSRLLLFGCMANDKFHNLPIITCSSSAILLMIHLAFRLLTPSTPPTTYLHASTVELPPHPALEGGENFAALAPRHVQLVSQLQRFRTFFPLNWLWPF